MSENAKRRQTAANAIVRVLQGASSLPGPSEPANPLGRLELLRGGEFKAWDARVDAIARLQRLPLNEMSTRCLRAVQRVSDEPSVKRIRLARRLLFRESKRQDLPHEFTKEYAVAHELLAFNLAAMGCEQANAEVTAAALLQFNTLLNHARYEDAYLCLRTAIVWAGETEFDNTDRPYYPEPNYAYLSEFHLHTEHFLEFATALHDAEKAVREQDDVLRGGVGQLAPRDGDLAVELDGLEAGTDPPAAENPAPEPPPGRSLVVVGSLEHLPKPSKASQDRRDSPRAEFERIENKALPLLPAPDPQAFVEEGAARAPWLRPLFEILAQDLVGAPYAWLRPTALVSPPGYGKTAAVRAIARGLGIPLRIYNAAGASDGSFGGTSRQWGSGRGSISLQTALNESVANCIIGVDEIEKSSLERRNGSLVDTLLPYLERENSKSIFDIYIETNVNLSAFTYLVTANTVSGVPGPLLDRLRILEVPAPGPEHLPVVAANILAEIRGERGLDATWLPDLDGDELDLLSGYWRGGSLRPLRRLIDTLVAGRDRLAPRH